MHSNGMELVAKSEGVGFRFISKKTIRLITAQRPSCVKTIQTVFNNRPQDVILT